MEYRPVPDARLQEFENVAHYAFSPEDEPGDSDRLDDPSFQIGEPRALFDDEELTIVCRLLELDARCRDDWITLGGLRSVATPPERRREGRAAALLRSTLEEFADRAVPLVALWPFDHDFYAKYGWATAAKRASYRLPPESLAPVARNEAGRLVRPSVDEWERLRRVNLAAGAERSLSLRRSEHWWRHRVFERAGTKRHVYAWERDGDLASYVVFSVDADDEGRVLRVDDLACIDDEAFAHLAWVLFNHDSQVEAIELTGDPVGEAGSLLDRVASPESVTCELEHGAMVRVADVPAALESLSYPDDLEATVDLRVRDELAAWNDDVFEVSFDRGAARVHRRSDDGDSVEADVSADVGALSQLLVGYRSVDQVVRSGGIAVEGDGSRTVLERAFPAHSVGLTEFF